VREGKKVLAVNPTCSYMMRKEYGELVGTPEAREVAAAAMDPCEFLFQLKQEGSSIAISAALRSLWLTTCRATCAPRISASVPAT